MHRSNIRPAGGDPGLQSALHIDDHCSRARSLSLTLSFLAHSQNEKKKKNSDRYLFISCFQCQQNVVTLRRLNPINPTPPLTDAAPGGGRGDRTCSDERRLLDPSKPSRPTRTHPTHTRARTHKTNINSLAGVASVTSGSSDRRDTVSGGGRLIDVTPLPASILLDG